MRRKQLHLDESSEQALKRLAARTGRSEASHLREALRRYLGDQAVGEGDPLERLIGFVPDRSGPDDVAENHDHYLYGTRKTRA
jgi:hypothetical protein